MGRGVVYRSRRVPAYVAVAAVLGASSACSSGPAALPGRPSNAAACAAGVERVNALGACVQVTYDAENLCEGASELPPEMGAYYACLTERSRCDGDVAMIGEGCVAPRVRLDHGAQRVAGPVEVAPTGRRAEGGAR